MPKFLPDKFAAGAPLSVAGLAEGLRKLARAVENMSVHNGHVDWSNNTPKIVVTGGASLTDEAPEKVDAAAASEGDGAQAARSDHKHQADVDAPVSIGTENQEGSASTLARSDHVHEFTASTFESDIQDLFSASATQIDLEPQLQISGGYLQIRMKKVYATRTDGEIAIVAGDYGGWNNGPAVGTYSCP
jgi:hypothetical protein